MSSIYIRPSSRAAKRKQLAEPIMIVHRHWFGFFTLIGLGLGLIILFGLIIIFIPFGDAQLGRQIDLWAILFLISLLGGLLFTVIWWIYFSNRLILTADMISQKMQLAIFKHKQSQLGLANIEDVTMSRDGVFQTLMNFGTLTIETAGEQNNFDFRYCPDPVRCAKIIMEVRADFLADNPDVVDKLR